MKKLVHYKNTSCITKKTGSRNLQTGPRNHKQGPLLFPSSGISTNFHTHEFPTGHDLVCVSKFMGKLEKTFAKKLAADEMVICRAFNVVVKPRRSITGKVDSLSKTWD